MESVGLARFAKIATIGIVIVIVALVLIAAALFIG